MRTGYRLGFLAILGIVLLRVAIGWHFFAEGVKKYTDPKFSAAPFLLQAKGPLAPLFQKEVPGFHRWRELLATPRQDVALSEDEKKQLTEWQADYKKRSDEAKKANEPPPVELPPVAAYQPWGKEILGDWGEMLSRVEEAADLDEEAQNEASAALRKYSQRLADYLVETESEIVEYRHELYRLEQMTDSAVGLPYLDDQIAVKRAQTGGAPNAWIAEIGRFESSFVESLHAIMGDKADQANWSEEQIAAIDSAILGSDKLPLINMAVTWLTLGVGVLLMAGFFTRIASLAGGMFLLSVVATQPPWVADAIPVYYQVVEFFALCVLFAVGAGRWAGLDFFSYAFWSKCCGRKE